MPKRSRTAARAFAVADEVAGVNPLGPRAGGEWAGLERDHAYDATPGRLSRDSAIHPDRCGQLRSRRRLLRTAGDSRRGTADARSNLRTLGGWAGWREHAAGSSGTPVTGRTRTSGASVYGSASAAAKSPTSRSTRGLHSHMSQTTDASKSAGVTGAVRSSLASCINGARGSTSAPSSTSANATPAVAVTRKSTPAICHRSVDRSARPRASTSAEGAHRALSAMRPVQRPP